MTSALAPAQAAAAPPSPLSDQFRPFDPREGANLLLVLGSAGRDECHCKDGGALDVSRHNAKEHVAFGLGIHYCLGAPLARLEATILLQELTQRLPSLRLAESQSLEYLPNTSFRGPRHLQVAWDTTADSP